MPHFHNLLLFVLFIAIAGFATVQVLESVTATGPNCPDKDPSWLGYCDQAPVLQ